MFQPAPKQQFSFHSFSLLSQLVQISQSFNNSQSNSHLINEIDEDFTKTTNNKYYHALFSFLKQKALAVGSEHQQQIQDIGTTPLGQSFKSFLNCFSQSKVRINNQQLIVQNLHSCKFLIADKRRVYSLKQQLAKKQLKNKHRNNNTINVTEYRSMNNNPSDNMSYRAFIVYGKAVNVEKNKKSSHVSTEQAQGQGANSSAENAGVKEQTIANLEFCMTHLYNEGKLPFIKSEPHELQDILLTHYLDDSSLLPILVTHEVYRLFVPIEGAIILLIPQQLIQSTKHQIPSIIKNTVLHVYMDNYKVLCKTIARESFFKNTTFRGIYFVEEGEVETNSGRVVARGWVISGKCRSTSQVCKFTKIMAFFKYVLENENVWKQFTNDLKLNGEWPIKVSDVLNLDQKTLEQLMGSQASTFKLNSSNPRQNRLKFPPISSRLNKSFDLSKLTEIDKMKHYDEKMSHLHQFKQEMLKRKIELGAKRGSGHYETQGAEDEKEKEMNKRIQILSQKMNLSGKGLKSDVSKSMILRPGESSANILVTGIVQKLKSIHEGQERNSLEKLGNGESKRQLLEVSRSKTKILGLKRYEEALKNEKYHLFKGKNFYH